jgi:hypothetical protein
MNNNASQQDFGPRKVYCVSNVTFHAESKYAIKIFQSHTVFVQWHFYYWFFKILAIFFSDFFFYMNKYFKLFWTQGGHIQVTVIITLAVCAHTQEVNKRALNLRITPRAACQRPACTRFHARAGDWRFCVLRYSDRLETQWRHWERALYFWVVTYNLPLSYL